MPLHLTINNGGNMKLTKIRFSPSGHKLSAFNLNLMVTELNNLFKNKGYITRARVVNSSRIDISGNNYHFRLDKTKHSYNQYEYNGRKTLFPTWEQRVEFNNTLNEYLDKCNVECNIKSMHYIIRQGFKSFKEVDWVDQVQDWEIQNWRRGFRIVSL